VRTTSLILVLTVSLLLALSITMLSSAVMLYSTFQSMVAVCSSRSQVSRSETAIWLKHSFRNVRHESFPSSSM
jgi:hypothetical protein